ncbi:MAG TPA: response regulator transcription factor, partial [Burkholderiales bacterium]|nr:response regulator transcription factor [Burkholderiales bacterium]
TMPAHTTNPGIRVMLVDKHRLVLCGLQRIIDDEKPDLAVVGTSTSCENAVDLAADVAPDVVVLDAALSAQNEAVVPLMSERNMRVLLLGAMDASLTHEVAILRGACGVVRKEDTPEVLIKAIKSVHSGELWLDRSTTGRLFVELSRQNGRASANPVSRKLGSLTSREHDIVRSLVSRPGADNKTLAEELHIGEHTLRNHLSRIYDKLGVPNRVELYIFAQRHGVNRPSP